MYNRQLKAWAYLLRTEKNAYLIAEIEGGIKREVSVGCSVARRVCSICGAEGGTCQHTPGQRYGEQLCYLELRDPTDAYEWSFVAVPAQRKADVYKRQPRTSRSMSLSVYAVPRPPSPLISAPLSGTPGSRRCV